VILASPGAPLPVGTGVAVKTAMMPMIRPVLVLGLAAALGLPLVGCGGPSGADESVSESAAAISPGCSPALPTRIRGSVVGSDGRSVDAVLGVDLSNSAGVKVAPDGVPTGSADYSATFSFNHDLPATGTAAPNQERDWYLCVSPEVKKAYYELYPKGPSGTDESRYGETVYQYVDTSVIGDYNVGLRLPLTYANGGNTGNVQGYVWCAGRPVKATTLRAWSDEPGWACGIRSFAASGASAEDGYYTIQNLAAGQCWAPAQATRIYVYGECNGAVREVEKFVNIEGGKNPRVDIFLPTE